MEDGVQPGKPVGRGVWRTVSGMGLDISEERVKSSGWMAWGGVDSTEDRRQLDTAEDRLRLDITERRGVDSTEERARGRLKWRSWGSSFGKNMRPGAAPDAGMRFDSWQEVDSGPHHWSRAESPDFVPVAASPLRIGEPGARKPETPLRRTSSDFDLVVPWGFSVATQPVPRRAGYGLRKSTSVSTVKSFPNPEVMATGDAPRLHIKRGASTDNGSIGKPFRLSDASTVVIPTDFDTARFNASSFHFLLGEEGASPVAPRKDEQQVASPGGNSDKEVTSPGGNLDKDDQREFPAENGSPSGPGSHGPSLFDQQAAAHVRAGRDSPLAEILAESESGPLSAVSGSRGPLSALSGSIAESDRNPHDERDGPLPGPTTLDPYSQRVPSPEPHPRGNVWHSPQAMVPEEDRFGRASSGGERERPTFVPPPGIFALQTEVMSCSSYDAAPQP
ncbi:hypothetical protein T484DRAFT_1959330 [Baffinella frigidus]|nr:hypothetical protein T484DRAFT_1959330 [Cryptophyta sp. CCMP2293]